MTQSRFVTMFSVALLAAAACPAAAQQPAAPAAPASYKIGFVNTERVLRDSAYSKQLQSGLDAEYLKREREIEAGPKGEIERRRATLTDDMNLKREDSLKQLIEKANAVIRRLGAAEKFDAVFLEAAYTSARIDITDRVIKVMDAER